MKANKLWRSVKIATFAIVGLLVAYAVAGTLLSVIPVNRHAASDGDIVIYLERSDVHTDIVVPTQSERIDWSAIVPPADTKTAVRGEYISFGWGSRDFYLNVPTWNDLTIGIALKAVLGTGGTALHTWYENRPKEGANCRKLTLSSAQYDALVKYILASGRRDDKGAFVRLDHDGYGKNDAFYEGTGRYSPFFTCNTWANSALRTCGQKCCLWTAFQQPIFWKYQQTK